MDSKKACQVHSICYIAGDFRNKCPDRGTRPMTETREIRGHAPHNGQGPHVHVPAGFTPMRLRIESLAVELVITCPVATLGRHSDADIRIALAVFLEDRFPDQLRRHLLLARQIFRVSKPAIIIDRRVDRQPVLQA